MDFTGKRVLITGAGKGIGRETALLLAARGAHAVALSRTKADLDSLDAEIGCTSIVVDLADGTAARAAAVEGLPADYLVNCAGINGHAVNTRAAMIVAQEYARARIAAGSAAPS